jgi:hypothetical protein
MKNATVLNGAVALLVAFGAGSFTFGAGSATGVSTAGVSTVVIYAGSPEQVKQLRTDENYACIPRAIKFQQFDAAAAGNCAKGSHDAENQRMMASTEFPALATAPVWGMEYLTPTGGWERWYCAGAIRSEWKPSPEKVLVEGATAPAPAVHTTLPASTSAPTSTPASAPTLTPTPAATPAATPDPLARGGWRLGSWVPSKGENDAEARLNAVGDLQRQLKTECFSNLRQYSAQVGARDTMEVSSDMKCTSHLNLRNVGFEHGKQGVRARVSEESLREVSVETAATMASKLEGAYGQGVSGLWDPMARACLEVGELANQSPYPIAYNGPLPTQRPGVSWPSAAAWCNDFFFRQIATSLELRVGEPKLHASFKDQWVVPITASLWGKPLREGFFALQPGRHLAPVEIVNGKAELAFQDLVQAEEVQLKVAIVPRALMADSLNPLALFEPRNLTVAFGRLIRVAIEAEVVSGNFVRLKPVVKTLHPSEYLWEYGTASAQEASPLVALDSLRPTAIQLTVNGSDKWKAWAQWDPTRRELLAQGAPRRGESPSVAVPSTSAALTPALTPALAPASAPLSQAAPSASFPEIVQRLVSSPDYGEFNRLLQNLKSRGRVRLSSSNPNREGWYAAGFDAEERLVVLIDPDGNDAVSAQPAANLQGIKQRLRKAVYFQEVR